MPETPLAVLLIENGTVYTPLRVIPDGAVLVEGQRILAVGRRSEIALPADALRLDAGGGVIAPGFVNMHVHGIGGRDALDGDVDGLQAMSLALARGGVTSWAPSLASAPFAVLEAAVAAGQQAMACPEPMGAEILGMHVEARYLSPHERGAHPAELLADPRPEEWEALLCYQGAIRSFTLAPELPGALELIRALKERGILVSAGHSIAVDDEFERAVAAGLSHATHLFCNMGTLRRVNIRRVAGLVESILLDDRVTAEIIADGYHIAPSLMRLALKIKGPERLALVTDGSRLTGLPPGRYTDQGRELVLEENITYLADRSAYAGSVATMDHCLRCAIESMDLSLPVALRMASLTPASILGVAGRKGSLEPGKDADIVLLDGSLHVAHAVTGGQLHCFGPGTSALPSARSAASLAHTGSR